MYTAILLDEESKAELKEAMLEWFNHDRYQSWRSYCHHLTLNMGPMSKGLNSTELLNSEATIEIDAVGWSDKVTACRATKMLTLNGEELKSTNEVPHITLAVNVHEGGKPVMSNDITMWIPVPQRTFCGKVVEIGT